MSDGTKTYIQRALGAIDGINTNEGDEKLNQAIMDARFSLLTAMNRLRQLEAKK